jgi:hypothetical protein
MKISILDEQAKTRVYGRNNAAPIPVTDDSIIRIIPGQVMDLLRQNPTQFKK